ncbi:MAG: GTP-binding protein [Nitrospirae bacterium RIFCSPLOWO2_02_FULL_62_14]|nr:MAG: GTP-binding protein [Nitrospirae bacterium RIFCSPLOWO2_02_FULL_62_14]OGW69719.1 MAG: GTP-binding protein [Nitrospirae bacterium RIFCSPLOWO2_01_FULL_62_17]OGW99414.1 MAG: GTP-binding protein [Nitrospirae bacterium RIFCSPLOWO2_12_FULL_63_8]
MKILSVEFIKSCEQPDQFPQDRLPALAFVGRSNVGKSSLINSLLHRKGIARVSRTPGKTQLINFFLVTTDDPKARRFYVVDLPGYGYAKVSKTVRARWQPLIEQYLTGSEGLRGVLLLVDSRGTERQDAEAVDWLLRRELPVLLVATKSDKLTRSERAATLPAMREVFELPGDVDVVAYSSVTHEGRDALWQAIRTMLTAPTG